MEYFGRGAILSQQPIACAFKYRKQLLAAKYNSKGELRILLENKEYKIELKISTLNIHDEIDLVTNRNLQSIDN